MAIATTLVSANFDDVIPFLPQYSVFARQATRSAAFLLFVFASVRMVGRYLRGLPDYAVNILRNFSVPFITNLQDEWENQRGIEGMIKNDNSRTVGHLLRRVARLESRVDAAGNLNDRSSFSSKEFENLLKTARQELSNQFTDDFVESVEEKFADGVLKKYRDSRRYLNVELIRERLMREIADLGRRGNVNLIFGILITFMAIGLLIYFVLSMDSPTSDWQSLLPTIILRASLVLFVEVFAFFFLRLYRSSLQEIKYFQNELSTVELRIIAMDAAVATGDTSVIYAVASDLAKTERNFVLKKGESTTQAQRTKSESEGVKEAVKLISDLASGFGK